ncbi:MAG TPA: aminotransferase class I/II-fold pyridoxal phosphate-dependent enzyme, partial [Myxococcota bacterium]|nr:aminotransferase class I/II-fold pyridoxal phosphate-dependent enzyme [Myxococcota bacterium]
MSGEATAWIGDALGELAARDLRRVLLAPHGVDLSSNDYLGLASHPEVRSAIVGALRDGLPTGAAGSRLLSGQHRAWESLEATFAAWQGSEAALAMGSGFAANVGVVTALAGPGDLVVSDALNHASLIDGVRLCGARRVIVPHGDVGAVDEALAAGGWRRALVVVESVYSMDGDEADLVGLAEVCARRGAMLVVDEAHATGLFGPEGQGRVAALGLRD